MPNLGVGVVSARLGPRATPMACPRRSIDDLARLIVHLAGGGSAAQNTTILRSSVLKFAQLIYSAARSVNAFDA
jgi:hypothetical protein